MTRIPTFLSKIDRSSGNVIQSLLDNDTYKFSMAQFVLHQCPSTMIKARFKCRAEDIDLIPYEEAINKEVDHLCTLRFTEKELEYLQSIRYITPDFVEFCRVFQFNRKHIKVRAEENKLDITIEGPWLYTILFEIPVLKIVHEVYSQVNHPDPDYKEGERRLFSKVKKVKKYLQKNKNNAFSLADFGTRRAFSGEWHEKVISTCAQLLPRSVFPGTSNVLMAMLYQDQGIVPIGTMAHEVFQAAQVLGPKPTDCQKWVLDKWAREYRGDLGIALTDTLGMDKFLIDFDMYFAKLFDGVRHDSGDPFEWGDKIIEHYKKMRIDPRTKVAVFSDGLDIDKAIQISEYFKGRIKVSFGIGTNLTNDLGYRALQIVIKLTETNGKPVAKISNDPGKVMCEDPEYIEALTLEIKKETDPEWYRKVKAQGHLLRHVLDKE